MNRRGFVKRSALGMLSAILFSMGFTGCNAVADLEQWIPIALSAVDAIVKLLGPVIPAPVAAIIVLIQAAFAALLATLHNYQKGTGVLSDITNGITAVEESFQKFFAALNVPSGLLATIEALAEIILSTIAGFANKINPAPAPASLTLRVSGNAKAIAPKLRSEDQFVKDFDAAAVANGHPEAQIK